jgi:type VI secretion system secreted protein Hcp
MQPDGGTIMAIDIFLVIPPDPSNPVTEAPEPDPSLIKVFPPSSIIIPVTSFQLEVSNAVTIGTGSTGAGGGKVEFNPLTITKPVDEASPGLFKLCATGGHFAVAQLYLRQSAGGTWNGFLAYEFKTLAIAKIDWGGATGEPQPTEAVTMEYEALVIQYKVIGPTGTTVKVVQQGWDRVMNTGGIQPIMPL